MNATLQIEITSEINMFGVESYLEAGYRAMAEDTEREIEAQAWCNGLTRKISDETW